MQIVQVDQRFSVFHKPILAGDVLHARMDVHSVVEAVGRPTRGHQEPFSNVAGVSL